MRRKSTKFNRVDHLTTDYTARVKFNEVDSLGIVWHGNYISYFEEGREAFGRKHGLDYLEIKRNHFTTPIVDVNCNYKLPLKYGDIYTIKTSILDHPAAKIVLQYEIFNENEQLICEGQTTQVFVDLEGKMMLYKPLFFQEWQENVNFK